MSGVIEELEKLVLDAVYIEDDAEDWENPRPHIATRPAGMRDLAAAISRLREASGGGEEGLGSSRDHAPAAGSALEGAERLAQRFHEAYERLALAFDYYTRPESAKPWADVPEQNRRLMIAVCAEVFGLQCNTPADAVPGIPQIPIPPPPDKDALSLTVEEVVNLIREHVAVDHSWVVARISERSLPKAAKAILSRLRSGGPDA